MAQTNKLRIGIVSQAHIHAHSYSDALAHDTGVELVGIWDEDERAGSSLASARGMRFYKDLDELLDQKLDGAIVTSENVNHRRNVEAAAEAGVKAILCEKPIATTVADAQAMIDACAKSGTKLATAFPCRFSPVFKQLSDDVHAGKLGKIVAVRGTNHGKIPWQEPEFKWFVDKAKSGGGSIIDHTVHVADLNRILLGSEAVEVHAERSNNLYHQAWEDCGFLTITYGNGVFTTLDSSWSRPLKSFPTWGDVTYHVVGTAGTASLDLLGQASTYYSEADGGTKYLGWASNTDAAMVADFLLLAGGGQSLRIANGEDGLAALRVALAAYESVKTGRPVKI